MNTKNIVRKAVALGSGAALVGTTLMGAFAYDLSTYPAKFVVDGKFDGKIVVGEKAATPDVVGAIDIAASLQSASVSKVPVAGQAGKVTFDGDSYAIGSGADSLELRELINDVDETITEEDLMGLKGGKITTQEGTTNYKQYLRLDGTGFADMAVNYVTNDGEDNEKMGDYLVVERDAAAPFLEWEVQFDNGLESEVEDGELPDLEDKVVNIMGTDYNVVGTSVATANDDVELTFMGGSVPDTLREGETKTYTINGVDYEVTLVFVSDPSSGGTPEVKFSINGEMTQAMAEGDTDTLSGGMQVGVRDILVNAREGVASFYLGAHKLVLTDDNYATTGYNGGDISINEDVDESDVVEISATEQGANLEITSIKYQLIMDSKDGSAGVAYVPKGKGVRELMEDPELFISDSLDIKYAGLTAVTTTDFKVEPSGDDTYKFTFTNIDGKTFKGVPLLFANTGVYKFGSEDDDLIFTEGAATAYPITMDDYVLVSSKAGADADRAVSHVLRYSDYDADQRTIEFEDLSGGTVTSVLDTAGNGTIKVGGHTYLVGVDDVAADDSDVKLDMNGNGAYAAGEKAVVTTKGGLSINTTAVNATSLGAVANFDVEVKARNFDSNVAETFGFTVTKTANAEMEIDYNNDYVGPYGDESASVGAATTFDFEEKEDNSDYDVAMTDYGVLIQQKDNDNDPDSIVLTVPSQQVLPQVFVTMGTVSSSEGSAGSADKVNPIAVGLAVLDTNAPAVGTENMIVVGGPCANTVALELMGSPAVCSEGFEAGKATIKAFEKSGKVAILVAGYDAQDTQGASKVLAAYKDYSLKGAEVEVVVADMNSIKVTSVN